MSMIDPSHVKLLPLQRITCTHCNYRWKCGPPPQAVEAECPNCGSFTACLTLEEHCRESEGPA